MVGVLPVRPRPRKGTAVRNPKKHSTRVGKKSRHAQPCKVGPSERERQRTELPLGGLLLTRLLLHGAKRQGPGTHRAFPPSSFGLCCCLRAPTWILERHLLYKSPLSHPIRPHPRTTAFSNDVPLSLLDRPAPRASASCPHAFEAQPCWFKTAKSNRLCVEGN